MPSPEKARTKAGPVLRAGFTEVLVTGIEIRWIKVRVSPMARPPATASSSRAPSPMAAWSVWQ